MTEPSSAGQFSQQADLRDGAPVSSRFISFEKEPGDVDLERLDEAAPAIERSRLPRVTTNEGGVAHVVMPRARPARRAGQA
jgi:hypothetical protein